jgi:hypothetical protein
MTDRRPPDQKRQARRLKVVAALIATWAVVVFILVYTLGGHDGLRGSLPVAGCALFVTWVALALTGRLMRTRRRREQKR